MLTPRARRPLLGLALAAVAGIEIADAWNLPAIPLFGGAVVLLALCWVIPRTALCLAFTATVFAACHTIRHHENPGRELEATLAAGPRVATVWGIVISDPEPLAYSSRKRSGMFRLQVEQMEIGDVSSRCKTRLAVTWSGPLPVYGDRVRLRGSLQPLLPSRNPGEFEYAAYLRRQGIFASFDAPLPQDCVVPVSYTHLTLPTIYSV